MPSMLADEHQRAAAAEGRVHPNILKIMRDANLVTLSTSSTRTLFGKKSWQKLRENEGEIGYFLVKFGVELWGGIFN